MEGFRAALGRIGFNLATRQEIINNGFVNIASLATVTDEDISDLVKHIGTWKVIPVPAPLVPGVVAPPTVNLPFISVKKLRAMRMWVIMQTRKGITINAAECTNAQITLMITRANFLVSRESSEESAPKVPDVLSSFTQWRTWWESWHTYTK